MKKIILILFLFGAHLSFGQVKLGLKGGIGDAWFNRGQGNQTIYPAYAFGGLLNYSFGKVSFQPELLFSHKGSRFLQSFIGYNKSARANTNLNYLEIPLSFYYSIKEADETPYLGVGLAPAILLSAKYIYKDPNGNKFSTNINNINAVDLGFLITAGYKMDKFFVEARANLGLPRVYPNSNIRNSVVMIMGGMTF